MASNSFGNIFRITTFGESHGKAYGVVVDGCPAGIMLNEENIDAMLQLRAPGKSEFVSPRQEKDEAEILAGVFDGKTTGAPITIIIKNKVADSSKYNPIEKMLRPGHANFTYLNKYGACDHRGGGRASARETVCRVAAGAVAKKILDHYKIKTAAYLKSVGGVKAEVDFANVARLREYVYQNVIYCPDVSASALMIDAINKVKAEGDSVGGVVEFVADNLPVGLGDPVYEKLSANLAKAMMSIPAAKGFEIGEGFNAAKMQGSKHNDLFTSLDRTLTNYAGGVLGGITTGMQLIGRVAFKPTPSIFKGQKTVDIEGRKCNLQLPEGSRHDPCVAVRAVPVVEAMCMLVVVDALLLHKSVRL